MIHYYIRSLLFHFAVDHITIARSSGWAAFGLGLLLTLRIHLLTECVESVLQFLSELLDFFHVIALSSLLQLADFGFDRTAFGSGNLVTEFTE